MLGTTELPPIVAHLPCWQVCHVIGRQRTLSIPIEFVCPDVCVVARPFT